MSNNTLVSQLAYGRDEPFPFVFLWGVITGIGIAHSAMFLIFTKILRNQMKRNIYKRESKLADLITEFSKYSPLRNVGCFPLDLHLPFVSLLVLSPLDCFPGFGSYSV